MPFFRVLGVATLCGVVFVATHASPHSTLPKSQSTASFTMPKSDAPMDSDAQPMDEHDWLNDHSAQANVMRLCDFIGAGEYEADRVADGLARQRMGIANPDALAADRQSVTAEMKTLRLHSCRELADMPFVSSWTPLR